jgi:hypothetical protein
VLGVASKHSQIFSERSIKFSVGCLTWQEHVPPLDCQASQSPAVPPAGLYLLCASFA